MESRHWSTQQLTELLTAVAELPDQATIVRRAVEHAAESLECEVAALVVDRSVLHSLGYRRDCVPVEQLVEVAGGGHAFLEVEGVGPCVVATTDCDALSGARLLLARTRSLPFSQEERALLRGMAQVLSLALQARRLVCPTSAACRSTSSRSTSRSWPASPTRTPPASSPGRFSRWPAH